MADDSSTVTEKPGPSNASDHSAQLIQSLVAELKSLKETVGHLVEEKKTNVCDISNISDASELEGEIPNIPVQANRELTERGIAGSRAGPTNDGSELSADSDNESTAFCVEVKKVTENQDVFSLLEADLEKEEEAGPPVPEKLAKIVRNRFREKAKEQKLKDKLSKTLAPENCSEIKPPLLNEEVVRKADLERSVALRDDARLAHIQALISKAAAALLYAADRLNADVTAQSEPAGTQQGFVEAANHMLRTVGGDVMLFLGAAQQELSTRRRYQLQSALPDDIASICGNPKIQVTSQLFGDDVEKSMREAREAYRAKSAKRGTRGAKRGFHPYRRDRQNFLDQPPLQYHPRGSYRGRGKTGNFRGKSRSRY